VSIPFFFSQFIKDLIYLLSIADCPSLGITAEIDQKSIGRIYKKWVSIPFVSNESRDKQWVSRSLLAPLGSFLSHPFFLLAYGLAGYLVKGMTS
jgi:hypothetical protein